MRQRDPQERRALGALHDGQPARWLEWAGQAGRIETFSDPAGACGQALAEWARKTGESGLARTVMIARDNDTRERLNRGARELRSDTGAIGGERSYGTVEVAVGDRVICRRNDGPLDVDNGMRGTVRHVDAERVVIDTDGGLVRELPAAYVAEHVEHAYALTGHGMQGGTVEAAVVVASPRDLTAGWSYTALSRARGETRLLIHDEQFSKERSDFAPEGDAPISRDDLLARVGRGMVERDDEDLAIEQLPGAAPEPAAGRADDPHLASGRTVAAEPPQEQAAARAEPATPAAASTERLRELEERMGSSGRSSRRYRRGSFSASKTSTRASSPSPTSARSSPNVSLTCRSRKGAGAASGTQTPSSGPSSRARRKPTGARVTPYWNSEPVWSTRSAIRRRPAPSATASTRPQPDRAGAKGALQETRRA